MLAWMGRMFPPKGEEIHVDEGQMLEGVMEIIAVQGGEVGDGESGRGDRLAAADGIRGLLSQGVDHVAEYTYVPRGR